jgi:hypothetical protein
VKIETIVSSDPRALLEHAADGFLAPPPSTRDDPFPSPTYLLALRQGGLRDDLIALAAERGVRGWFDPPLCLFGELPKWLGATARKPCGDFERVALLGNVLRRTAGKVFGKARRVEDFLGAVDRLFGELVSEGIEPKDYEAALASLAERDAFERDRDAELGRAYRLYSEELEKAGMRDGRDTLVDGARFIAEGGALAAKLRGRREIRIYGLADLRGGWGPLLRALDACPAVDRVVIYTTEDLPLAPELVRSKTVLPGVDSPGGRLFAADAPKAGSFELIAAPDIETEIVRVSSRVRALVDRGIAPHRIAIVARQARPLVDLAVRTLQRFGVPATARRRHAFREIPVIRAVLALFAAAAEGWQRHHLSEVAEQPYFASDLDARVINYIGYQRRVVGLGAWTVALEGLESEATRFEQREDRDDDHRKPPPPSWRVGQARVAFGAFAARVRPLDDARPLVEWLRWLETFLRDDPWRIAERIYAVPDERFEIARLDLQGWRGLLSVVRQWLAVVERWEPQGERIGAAAFHQQLAVMLDGDAVLWTETGQGVQVLEAFAAAYRSFDHVFLVGLQVGQFPQAASSSPLFNEGAREALRESGLALDHRADWEVRERSLFRVLVAGARETLTVSYAERGADERETIASAFVEALADVAEARDRPAYVTLEDLPALPVYDGPAVAEHAARVAEIERARETGALSPYNGNIEDHALRAELAAEFSDQYLWSPSQLESYAKCPWAYFSARLLRLEKLEDPEDDVDPAVRGTVLHDALARFYQEAIKRAGGPVLLREADRDWAAPMLLGALDLAMVAAKDELWLGAPALFDAKRAELRRMLLGYLDFEFGFGEDLHNNRSKKVTWVRTAVAEQERAFEEAVLERGGVAFRFRGRIDRVEFGVDDRIPAGSFVAAVDYKTSKYSAPGGGDKEAWDDGVVLQLPLYAHALAKLYPGSRLTRIEYRAVKQAMEVHPVNLLTVEKKTLALNEDEEAQNKFESALDAVVTHVLAARAGVFPAAPPPSCKCPPFCHAWEICRVKGGPETKGWNR